MSRDDRFLYVRRIYVEKLFGQYKYDLSLPDPSRLLILYGDNGSGKTTLLKTIFHLLAHGWKKGHKTFVARQKFRKLFVELGQDTAVEARRSRNNLVGAFQMSVYKRGKVVSKIDWVVNPEGRVLPDLQDQERQTHMHRSLSRLDVGLYLLSDDRTMRSNQYAEEDIHASEDEPEAKRTEMRHLRHIVLSRRARAGSRGGEELRAMLLRQTLDRVSAWTMEQVLRGSSKGDADANAIYSDIVQRIAGVVGRRKTGKAEGYRRDKLIADLEAQANRSFAFSKYGLTTPAHFDALISSIRRAPQAHLPTIMEVTRPYVDGSRARLDALQQVHDSIDAFITIINTFYRHKKVSFDLGKGISIVSSADTPLPADALSSGERQLLLLFCNILVASDQNSIFIIDEPELSLNVKWQRQLIRTLLDFTAHSRIQFLLATHSIELLARHKRNVAKLED